MHIMTIFAMYSCLNEINDMHVFKHYLGKCVRGHPEFLIGLYSELASNVSCSDF